MWRKEYPRASSSCRQCQATRPIPDSREISSCATWTMVRAMVREESAAMKSRSANGLLVRLGDGGPIEPRKVAVGFDVLRQRPRLDPDRRRERAQGLGEEGREVRDSPRSGGEDRHAGLQHFVEGEAPSLDGAGEQSRVVGG